MEAKKLLVMLDEGRKETARKRKKAPKMQREREMNAFVMYDISAFSSFLSWYSGFMIIIIVVDNVVVTRDIPCPLSRTDQSQDTEISGSRDGDMKL